MAKPAQDSADSAGWSAPERVGGLRGRGSRASGARHDRGRDLPPADSRAPFLPSA